MSESPPNVVVVAGPNGSGKSTNANHDLVAKRLDDLDKVQEVLKEAARQAVVEHQRAGLKIVVWRNGQVAWEEPGLEDSDKK